MPYKHSWGCSFLEVGLPFPLFLSCVIDGFLSLIPFITVGNLRTHKPVAITVWWQKKNPIFSVLGVGEEMDLGGKEKIGMEVGDPDYLGYHQMDSFYPPLWDQQPNPLSLGFQDSGNAHNVLVRRPQLDPVSQGGALFLQSTSGILPHALSNFQTDRGFIERAARLTSFGAAGVGPAGSPLGLSPSMDKYLRESIPLKNEVGTGEASELAMDVGNSRAHRDESDDADIGGSRSSLNSKDLAAKKRKRNSQSMEIDEMKAESSNPVEYEKVNIESMQKVEQNSSTPEQNDSITAKPNGKRAKDSTDAPKADYIHVRARRGQATNSHSLAERVRREKISERMKFLQDLVPGCSKVTGKAVMLDEIINYVQSLQRQVEFLSMKLAAVNPELDSNIEGILLKNIFQSQAGLASSNAFPPDMALPLLRSNQQALVPSSMSRIAPHFDAHRGAISTQMASLHTYSDPKLQVSNPWDEDIHTAIQMGLMGNPPLSLQEINEKNCGRFLT